jgi:tetratricopeptide (TPR) repeat protein
MAFINRGTARVHLNNLEGAIADFTKALKIRPSNDVALLNRGSALLELDNIHGALKDFEEVVSLDPNSSTGYLYRGAAKIKLAKSTENCTILSVAIEDLDKGI